MGTSGKENSNPFTGSAAEIEAIARSFEEAWLQGQKPSIDDYLHTAGTDKRALIIELVHADLELRLKAGEGARVENYLARYPELAHDADVVRDLIAAELSMRRRLETDLSLDEFVRRFPEYKKHLSALAQARQPGLDGATTVSENVSPALEKAPQRASSRLAPLSPPSTRVPGYEILGTLGRGGMGVVYKARHLELKRIVALKMILAGDHASPELLERFRLEARAVARIQHPNIVQIYEVGEAAGRPFFSLEFVDGGSLHKQMAGSPLSPQPAAALVETLARAMQVAHECGIVHRDLKPANILLASGGRQLSELASSGGAYSGQAHSGGASSGRTHSGGSRPTVADWVPKITDFGLAKQLEGDSGQTRSGAVMGTPSFMAPEQASGKAVGPLADVYALGAILYDLLTGRPPFKGADVPDTLDQVKHQEPVPPSRLQPKVPRDLETICLKCLRKEPAGRYASAAELADDLHRYLASEPIKARPVGLRERALKFARRRPWVVAAGVLAAALLFSLFASGGYYLYVQNQHLAAELKRSQERDEKRNDGAVKLRDGDRAFQAGDLPGARAAAEQTLVLTRDEPALEDLAIRARSLAADVERTGRATECGDHGFFHRILAAEEGDRAAHVRESVAAIQEALTLFGLTDGAQGPDFSSGRFSDDMRQKLTARCYQLLIAWSDVLALAPTPGADKESAEKQARLTEALRILDRAPRLGLVTRAYHQRRAELLKGLGRPADGERERQLTDAIMPELAVDFFLLGQFLVGLRRSEDAIDYFHKAHRLEPDHVWASYYLASGHIKTQRYEQAIEPLDTCIRFRPDFAWSYILRGFVRGQLGLVAENRRDRAGAALHYKDAYADFAEAEKHSTDDLTRYGILVNRSVIRTLQASALPLETHRLYELHHAAADFAQAIALRPRQYEAYANLADACLRMAYSDNAFEKLSSALLGGNPHQAYADLAHVQLRGAWSDQALEEFARAIALEDKSARLYRSRARLYLKRFDYAEALADLDRAIQHETNRASRDRADDYLESGRILYRQGKYAEALRAFDDCLKVVATLPPGANLPQPLQYRAEALIQLNRFEEALKSIDQFLTQAVPNGTAYRARGLAHAKLHQSSKAIEDFTEALELERREGKPPNPLSLAYRGWEYLVNDAPRLAVHDFDLALKQPGCDRVDCLSGRGYARALLGQTQLAVADAEAALNEKPALPRHWYANARIYAQVVAKMDADPMKYTAFAQDQRRRYEEKALQLLRVACEKTPLAERAAFWKDYVQADPALRAVKRSTLYAQLAAEYGRVNK
jgi:eukaryotic-like serine/threonine-protein kinase